MIYVEDFVVKNHSWDKILTKIVILASQKKNEKSTPMKIF